MLLQALSIVSGILLVTTLILATNFTVAKNIRSARLSYSLESASTRAFNDAQIWARDTLALQVTEGAFNGSLAIGSGSGQIGCIDTTCMWHFINSWRITGGTSDTGSGQLSEATNLESGVQEGRVSMIVTTTLYNSLSDPLVPVGTRSQLVTARTINVSPYFVITASQSTIAQTILSSRAEGDTAGVASNLQELALQKTSPSVAEPSAFYKTLITSTISCLNSADAQNKNANQDVPSAADMPKIPSHNYVPTDETLVWIYEAPCQINFIPAGAPSNFQNSVDGEFEHSGSVNSLWANGNALNNDVAR